MTDTMIKQMPKYECYLATEIDWIGDIPAHWSVKKAKFLFNEVNERSIDGSEELLSVSHLTGVSRRSEKNVTMFQAEDYTGSKLCQPGDLVMNIMWAWMGALGVSDIEGIVSPSYGVFRTKRANEFNSKFLEYLLKTPKYIEYYNKVSTGLHSSRLRFYADMFFGMKLGFPSFKEQNLIIEFLDKKISQIDEAIAIKQKQIELLKERKKIIVKKSVTQGLNPDVAMKDSDVGSIGQIPKHWKLMSLRYAFEFKNNMRVPLSAIDRGDMQGKYPYYGASGIIDYVDDYIFDEELILIAEDGANLLSKSTPLAFVASGKYWVNNHAHIIKPKFVGFKYWAELLSCLDYTIFISGAAQPKLTRDRLGSVKLPVPPEDEILEIVDFIELIIPPIDSEIELSTRQIEKLKEYKVVMINDAVTGKIKVMELA
ncbi:restriction endonuclease subunit S [Shewanella marinintestina]|uniref:restriction endonuclease subunit S n=1 Tax=Shewanella marinintestina TaxID=190305 RepID=UPI00200E5260|nr:restriction endonuclease subunit S [Shewanella marinintestina]MCL1145938.1 restriction endonuclease subunit S [Shewanella marinintestina]